MIWERASEDRVMYMSIQTCSLRRVASSRDLWTVCHHEYHDSGLVYKFSGSTVYVYQEPADISCSSCNNSGRQFIEITSLET